MGFYCYGVFWVGVWNSYGSVVGLAGVYCFVSLFPVLVWVVGYPFFGSVLDTSPFLAVLYGGGVLGRIALLLFD